MSKRPTAPQACAQCPWRASNQGRPHPHGFYSKANLRRLWNGLKQGARMTCHPTDSRMCEFEGYEHQEGRADYSECAGSLVLIQRELWRFQEIARAVDAEQAVGAAPRPGEALRRYRALPGPRMTREGLMQHAFAAAQPDGHCIPFLDVRGMRSMNLDHPDVGHEPLGAWTPLDRALDGAQENAA